MSATDLIRRLRAIALNGLVWGGGWFVGVMTMATAANVIEGRGFLVEGWELAVPGGILFTGAGMAFAGAITLALRGRKLHDLHWMRFGLGGGVVSFFFLPTLISVLRALSGDDVLPFTKLLSTGALGFIFGSVAAAGTLKLAQLADRYSSGAGNSEPELLTGDQSAPRMARDEAAARDREVT